MKRSKLLAKVLLLAGLCLAVGTIYICLSARNADPVMIRQPEGAIERADAMMKLICSGEYSKAGKIMYGTPSLGETPDKADSAESMIWKAFIDSMQYEFPGECYASGNGMALDVRVKCLQISSVTDALKERTQTLLNERVAAATDVTEIYDNGNNYREDFVQQVLLEATAQAISENAQMQEQTVALNMVYENNQWWVVPEAGLMDVLSGFAAG